MIETLFSLLVFVIFVCIVVAIVRLLPIPAPWVNILYMILGLALVVWLANYFGYLGSTGTHHLFVAHT